MQQSTASIMRYRPTQIIPAIICTILLLWFGISYRYLVFPSPGLVSVRPPAIDLDVPADGDILGHQDIVNVSLPRLRVARINITVTRDDIRPPLLMQPLEINLPTLTDMDADAVRETSHLLEQNGAATTIHIPRAAESEINASHFIFGVATTYERLVESLDPISHWAGGVNARIVGLMAHSQDPEAETKVLTKATDLNVNLGLVESGLDFLDRYFTLLKVLHDNRTPETKWYVFMDDDTFFLDLRKVIATFDKYDATKPYYIGALTEDFRQMAQWGFMAYGGAGIFLSAALVEELLPYYETCIGERNTGDRMLMKCIYHHTSTRLTWEHDLHQIDLHGDQAGFYEALRPQPLSIHHWKSRDFMSVIDVYNMSLVSSVCGNECILQKYKFKNGWVLTNGFSLVKYSKQDLKHRNMDTDISMERTWLFWGGTDEGHFEHALGPIRKPDQGKISYRLESAVMEGDGRVRQLYVQRVKGYESGAVKAAVEVVWIPG